MFLVIATINKKQTYYIDSQLREKATLTSQCIYDDYEDANNVKMLYMEQTKNTNVEVIQQ